MSPKNPKAPLPPSQFAKPKFERNQTTNGSSKDDRSSLLDIGRDTLPNMQPPRLDGREMVIRQFHYKWSRIACKHLGFLQHKCRNDNSGQAEEVEHRGDPPCIRSAHKHAHYKGNNWCLGTTRNHGGKHSRHTTVFLVLNGLSSKNTWYATTC